VHGATCCLGICHLGACHRCLVHSTLGVTAPDPERVLNTAVSYEWQPNTQLQHVCMCSLEGGHDAMRAAFTLLVFNSGGQHS
jgi:hypothetical protein